MTQAHLTITEASQACSISKRTLMRKINQLQDHGAYKDSKKQWKIPLDALIQVGFNPNSYENPKEGEAPSSNNEIDLLKLELRYERELRQKAEQELEFVKETFTFMKELTPPQPAKKRRFFSKSKPLVES